MRRTTGCGASSARPGSPSRAQSPDLQAGVFYVEKTHARMSASVKGFGCRPLTSAATGTDGRRPKASKGGNRDGGTCGGCRALYGDLSSADEAFELVQDDR